jgi:hypothetical protein
MKKSLVKLVQKLQHENAKNMSGGFKVLHHGIKGGTADNVYCVNTAGCHNDGDCSHSTNQIGCHNIKTCAI